MACVRVSNGFVCGPDAVIDLRPFGAHIWMEWHHYLGPTFFRSANIIKPIKIPSKKTWDAFGRWHKQAGLDKSNKLPALNIG